MGECPRTPRRKGYESGSLNDLSALKFWTEMPICLRWQLIRISTSSSMNASTAFLAHLPRQRRPVPGTRASRRTQYSVVPMTRRHMRQSRMTVTFPVNAHLFVVLEAATLERPPVFGIMRRGILDRDRHARQPRRPHSGMIRQSKPRVNDNGRKKELCEPRHLRLRLCPSGYFSRVVRETRGLFMHPEEPSSVSWSEFRTVPKH